MKHVFSIEQQIDKFKIRQTKENKYPAFFSYNGYFI